MLRTSVLICSLAEATVCSHQERFWLSFWFGSSNILSPQLSILYFAKLKRPLCPYKIEFTG
jgi:hypothetical protein